MSDPAALAMSRMYAKLQSSGFEEVQDATFTPASGDPVDCTVRIYTEDNLEPDGMMARVSGELTVIEYQRSEISRDAVKGETFTTDSATYTVQGIKDRDGVGIRVVVK